MGQAARDDLDPRRTVLVPRAGRQQAHATGSGRSGCRARTEGDTRSGCTRASSCSSAAGSLRRVPDLQLASAAALDLEALAALFTAGDEDYYVPVDVDVRRSSS